MSAKAHRRARGGKAVVPDSGVTPKAKANEFNAKGSPEMAEAKSKKETFKRGGTAGGMKSGGRLDRAPRASGGRTGSSPFTSAHSTKAPVSGSAGDGKTGSGPTDGMSN